LGISLFAYITGVFVLPVFIGDFVDKPTKHPVCLDFYWAQLWNLYSIPKKELI
jgi:hypothetical protein